MREDAAKALGKIGYPQVIPHLIPLLKDKDSEVREMTAEALAKISSESFAEVEEALREALKKDPAIKKGVFEALEKIGVRNPEA